MLWTDEVLSLQHTSYTEENKVLISKQLPNFLLKKTKPHALLLQREASLLTSSTTTNEAEHSPFTLTLASILLGLIFQHLN